MLTEELAREGKIVVLRKNEDHWVVFNRIPKAGRMGFSFLNFENIRILSTM